MNYDRQLTLPLLILLSVLTCQATAEPPEAKSDTLRVSYQSYYTAEIEAVIEAAAKAGKIKGYTRARAADDAFVKGHKGGEEPLKPKQKAAVEMGETDVLVFGKWWCWSDGKDDNSAMEIAARWGVKNNSQFRLLWQTHWALLGEEKEKRRGDVVIRKEQYLAPELLKPRYDKAHKQLEAKVDSINKQHDRPVVIIVPVANAVLKLRALVVEGAFPGVSKQPELYITQKWSGHRHIRMLTAYCNFAAIFGVSPEGLSPSVDHLKYQAKGGPSHSMAGITAEQHAILQKLAWDVVSEYPYSGISPSNTSLTSTKERHPELSKELDVLIFDLGKVVQLKLVKVPAKGKTFAIGSSGQEQDAVVKRYFDGKRPGWMDFENAHSVTMTDDYFIGQYEVTRGQFRRFVEETGYITETEETDGGYGWNEAEKKFEGRDKKYSWKNYGIDAHTDAYPVVNITRKDARKFCEWLEGIGSANGSSLDVRLPSEAEWEFACRAGDRSRFCFGDKDETLAMYANLADGTRRAMFPKGNGIEAEDGHVFAAPVGQYKPNAFGIYDMHGNVWEWCEDFYGKYASLPSDRNGLQTVNQGERRPVMRGGAWYAGPEVCRSAYRRLVGIAGRYGSGGFRVVCIPKKKEK